MSTRRRRGDHLSELPGQDDRTPHPLPACVRPARRSTSLRLAAQHNPASSCHQTPEPHSPVAATPRPRAAHSSSAHNSHSRAGRAMQPLASERGPASAAEVSASSVLAPTSRPPLRAGGQSQRRREGPPRPRPQVTPARGGAQALEADGAGRKALGLPLSNTWPPSLPPPVNIYLTGTQGDFL